MYTATACLNVYSYYLDALNGGSLFAPMLYRDQKEIRDLYDIGGFQIFKRINGGDDDDDDVEDDDDLKFTTKDELVKECF